MADNVTLNAGTGGETLATDDVGGVQYQRVKLTDGTADSSTVVAAGGGVEANALRVTIANDSTGVVSVDDNGGSLTVDGTITANAGSGPWPVTDNGGSLTVDGTVGVSGTVTVDSELTTADLDTGAGTDTRAVVGVVGAASGGGQLIPGSATDGLLVNLGANNDVTVSGTVTANAGSGPFPVSDNGGALTVDNAGTFAVQVDGNALTALQLIDDPVIQDDAAFTPATSKVMVAGFQADETATDSVDEGDAGAARMTLDRKVIVAPQPHSAGGLSIFRSLDIDETEEDVKTSPGCVYAVWVTNTATATRFLKFYNATAASVTVGTTTPVVTIGIPGNTTDDISGHFSGGGMGIFFDTAICVAATTAAADNDTGAPGAGDVIVNVFYK